MGTQAVKSSVRIWKKPVSASADAAAGTAPGGRWPFQEDSKGAPRTLAIACTVAVSNIAGNPLY